MTEDANTQRSAAGDSSARRLPVGACDTHAHVIDASGRFPFAPARAYTPHPAPASDYIAMLDDLGFDRGVLVQISVYGTDNRAMSETLAAHPDRLRGVAVVDPDVDDATLDALERAGVRGARINAVTGGGIPIAALRGLSERVASRGWHVQLFVDGATLAQLEPAVETLGVPVVFDHFGGVDVRHGIAGDGFRALLRLLAAGHAYVKLSGAYRIDAPPFDATIPLARALAEAAPDRCLWGTDWPHTQVAERTWTTADLVALFERTIPDPRLRARILVTNPAALYGFPP